MVVLSWHDDLRLSGDNWNLFTNKRIFSMKSFSFYYSFPLWRITYEDIVNSSLVLVLVLFDYCNTGENYLSVVLEF